LEWENVMISRDDLIAIERSLWKNDAVIYEAALIPDAMLVFAETGPITRGQAVAAIREENAKGRRWADVRFDDVLVTPLASDVALLHYRATARWVDEPAPIVVLASSVYVSRDGAWKLAFHQQSAVEKAPGPRA
jgi:hypothetical protein